MDLLGQPLFIFGVVLVVAGLVGGGLKAAGVEVPQLTAARAGVVAALGPGLVCFTYYQQQKAEFSITGVAISWNTPGIAC